MKNELKLLHIKVQLVKLLWGLRILELKVALAE